MTHTTPLWVMFDLYFHYFMILTHITPLWVMYWLIFCWFRFLTHITPLWVMFWLMFCYLMFLTHIAPPWSCFGLFFISFCSRLVLPHLELFYSLYFCSFALGGRDYPTPEVFYIFMVKYRMLFVALTTCKMVTFTIGILSFCYIPYGKYRMLFVALTTCKMVTLP